MGGSESGQWQRWFATGSAVLPAPAFPGSTLRIHHHQSYDSDLDESDLDEQELEDSLLSPAQLHRNLSQEELNAEKYFGLSGRDALFNHYKSVTTKRELRRDGARIDIMYEADRPRSPGRSYAENCLRLRMTPEPIHLRRVPTDRHLSLAHMGIGHDRRLFCVSRFYQAASRTQPLGRHRLPHIGRGFCALAQQR